MKLLSIPSLAFAMVTAFSIQNDSGNTSVDGFPVGLTPSITMARRAQPASIAVSFRASPSALEATKERTENLDVFGKGLNFEYAAGGGKDDMSKLRSELRIGIDKIFICTEHGTIPKDLLDSIKSALDVVEKLGLRVSTESSNGSDRFAQNVRQFKLLDEVNIYQDSAFETWGNVQITVGRYTRAKAFVDGPAPSEKQARNGMEDELDHFAKAKKNFAASKLAKTEAKEARDKANKQLSIKTKLRKKARQAEKLGRQAKKCVGEAERCAKEAKVLAKEAEAIAENIKPEDDVYDEIAAAKNLAVAYRARAAAVLEPVAGLRKAGEDERKIAQKYRSDSREAGNNAKIYLMEAAKQASLENDFLVDARANMNSVDIGECTTSEQLGYLKMLAVEDLCELNRMLAVLFICSVRYDTLYDNGWLKVVENPVFPRIQDE